MLNPQHIKTFAPHILINDHHVIKYDHLRQLWHSIHVGQHLTTGLFCADLTSYEFVGLHFMKI